MAENSKIEWTHHTFNPWMGCTKVAPGCQNCYAEEMMDGRLGKVKWGANGTRVKTSETYWRQPLKWNGEAAAAGKRPRVFCASLADVFEDWGGRILDHQGQRLARDTVKGHGYLPTEMFIGRALATMDDLRRDLFALIDATPNLDWLLLTKRPENILKMWPCKNDTNDDGDCHACTKPNRPHLCKYRQNVWLLTSVSDQKTANQNIPELLKCRAIVPVLGVSAEPLLEPIDFTHTLGTLLPSEHGQHNWPIDGLDWVIVGGESGPNARVCNIDWIRSIRDQCAVADVPVFIKQLGSRPYQDDTWLTGGEKIDPEKVPSLPGAAMKHPKGGEPEEWPSDLRVREFPEPLVPSP